MLCAEADTGLLAKCRGELLQSDFVLAETDYIANAQVNFPDLNPAIIPVQERAISRICIYY